MVHCITMEDSGIIDIELNEKLSPSPVENFKKLVSGLLQRPDVLPRHPQLHDQGGCPLGGGTGGPGWNIRSEFAPAASSTHQARPRRHQRWPWHEPQQCRQPVLHHAGRTHLDGQYAAFGKIIPLSMNVVDKIAHHVPTDWNDKPKTPSR